MERNPAIDLHQVENPATNPPMEDRTNPATKLLQEEEMEQNLATNLLIMEVVENLATNLPIVEVEENLATNLLAEEDLMAMEANPAIDPTPTVSQASNPATELQATIRSIPVAIGNPVIKTIYSHLKQCKYVISFCVFL